MIILSSVAALAAVATSPSREVLVTYAGCEGWGSWTVVPIEQVRPHVPEEFTIRGEGSGLAQIGTVVVTCPVFAVEGDPAPGFSYFVLFADLDSGVGSYDILEITDSAAWQGAMQVVDKASERAGNFTISYERAAGRPVRGEAAVAHQGRTILSSSWPAANAPAFGPIPCDHWGKGRHGIVEADHANSLEGLGAVGVRIEVEPGTLEAGI